MKRLLSVLGVFLIVGTIVVGVSATAQRYHAYRTSINYRRYGERVMPVAHRLRRQERRISTSNVPVQTVERIVAGGSDFYSRKDRLRQVWEGPKGFRPELYYGKDIREVERSVSRQEVNIISDVDYVFDNSVDFVQDDHGVYRSGDTSLAFRVYEVQDAHCNRVNFLRCVRSVMDSFRRTTRVRNIELQDFAFRQTLHGEFTYDLTYRETFIGRNGHVYFVMGLIHPGSDQLVRIEGVSLPGEMDRSSYLMHRVFESFQFRI